MARPAATSDSAAPATAAFAVDSDHVRRYVALVGEDAVIHRDRAAARAAGYRDLVAPPMFAAVYSAPAVWSVVLDVLGGRLDRMVHGAQEFRWGKPVCAGDRIATEAWLQARRDAGGMELLTFSSVSRNNRGDEVVRGTWTMVVRPE